MFGKELKRGRKQQRETQVALPRPWAIFHRKLDPILLPPITIALPLYLVQPELFSTGIWIHSFHYPSQYYYHCTSSAWLLRYQHASMHSNVRLSIIMMQTFHCIYTFCQKTPICCTKGSGWRRPLYNWLSTEPTKGMHLQSNSWVWLRQGAVSGFRDFEWRWGYGQKAGACTARHVCWQRLLC